MENNSFFRPHNLLNIIKLLDKRQKTAFKKYLKSPYFHQQTALLELFIFLTDILPNFSSKKLLKSWIKKAKTGEITALSVPRLFKRIYPGDTTADNATKKKIKLHKLCSELYRAVEDFIALSRYQKDEIRKYQYNAEFALAQNDRHHWELSMSRLKQTIDKQTDSLEHRYAVFTYYKMVFDSPFNERLDKRRAKQQLQQLFTALDIFQFMNLLAQTCEGLYRSGIIEESLDLALSKKEQLKLLEITKSVADQRYPLLHLYRELLLLKIVEKSFYRFRRIFQLLVSYGKLGLVNKNDQNVCMRYLLNYCTTRNNREESIFYLRVRKIVETWASSNEVLLVNNIMPYPLFLNACITAAGLKQYETVDRIIKKYSGNLPFSYQDASLALVRAFVLFFQAKTLQAAAELKKVNVQNYFYSIQKYLLGVRVDYILLLNKQIDEHKMYDTLKAARQFFRRNNYPVPKERRQSYLDMVLILQAMVDLHCSRRNNGKYQLRRVHRLKAERQPALSTWLTEQISNLT